MFRKISNFFKIKKNKYKKINIELLFYFMDMQEPLNKLMILLKRIFWMLIRKLI